MTHGTNGGYSAHVRADEKPCAKCTSAHAAYMRDYRAANPDVMAADRARSRALTRLASRHPAEYQRIYASELAMEPR